MDVKELTDRYMLDRSIENRNAIATALFEKLKIRVNAFIKKTKFVNDIPELYSHASVALLKAIERYDPSKNMSMSNWITAKIDYALMELITKHKRENRWASMHYCSPIADEEEGASLLDVGAKEDDCDNRIDLSYIWRLMESELTHRENIVVRMYYRDGLIHREIAEKFGFDYQQILRMCLCSLDKLRVAIKLKYPQIEEYYGKNAMDAYTGNQTGRIDYYTQSQRDSG